MLAAMTDQEDASPEDPGSPEAALFTRMRWNMPLSPEHAELLLDRLALLPGQRIADLGCGWGTLLRAAVARAGAGAHGLGIDTDRAALARGRAEAAQDGLPAGTIEYTEADVAGWRGHCNRALCTGASHAFGGTGPMLRTLAAAVPPGGRVLVGDGYWERDPSAAAVELFGDYLRPLPVLIEECRAAGWRVIHFSVADQREWDDFESTFRAGRQEWLLANPDDPRATGNRGWLDARERQYLNVYRGVLGFAYLVLAH
jgi:SAM-dependent methyltransferase